MPATGPDATNASCARGDHPCNCSALRRASVRWSASGNESGAGTGGTPGTVLFLEGGPAHGCRESAPDARDELAILIDPRRCAYIQPVLRWANENVLKLECQAIGEHYGRYRLHLPEAERAMARSLERYGQLSPIVVCQIGRAHV